MLLAVESSVSRTVNGKWKVPRQKQGKKGGEGGEMEGRQEDLPWIGSRPLQRNPRSTQSCWRGGGQGRYRFGQAFCSRPVRAEMTLPTNQVITFLFLGCSLLGRKKIPLPFFFPLHRNPHLFSTQTHFPCF